MLQQISYSFFATFLLVKLDNIEIVSVNHCRNSKVDDLLGENDATNIQAI